MGTFNKPELLFLLTLSLSLHIFFLSIFLSFLHVQLIMDYLPCQFFFLHLTWLYSFHDKIYNNKKNDTNNTIIIIIIIKFDNFGFDHFVILWMVAHWEIFLEVISRLVN